MRFSKLRFGVVGVACAMVVGMGASPEGQNRSLIIKQGACPALVNPASRGLTPMLLVGEVDFDASQAVLSSLELTRCDGVGGAVAPHSGPPGPGTRIVDLNHPNDDEAGCSEGQVPCACNADQSSDGIADMFVRICARFDLLAIQEIQDNLEGLSHIKTRLGEAYGMVASDITGSFPGQSPPPERLGFLYRWEVVARTEIASDITYDRSEVFRSLYKNRLGYWETFDNLTQDLKEWEIEKIKRKLVGKRAPSRPTPHLPAFLTFIRQPICVSFRVPGPEGVEPYEFLAVNAHLLFGRYADERYAEFLALTEWLVTRAKQADRLYHRNLILLGDLNLDFDNPDSDRPKIDADIKALNKKRLTSKKAAKVNFPFLAAHPVHGVQRSNARLNQTYDQVGLILHDPRLPDHTQNAEAGQDPDGFDFRVFNFVELFSQALHDKAFDALSKSEQKTLIGKFEHDFSDQMPIWIRLPKPA